MPGRKSPNTRLQSPRCIVTESAASLPVIVIGGGGHARVLVEALLRQGRNVTGFTDPQPAAPEISGVRHLGDDEVLAAYAPHSVRLVNGVGSVGGGARRQRLYEKYSAAGFIFDAVIHPSAIVASGVEIAPGAQIMAGVVLQPGVRIGVDSIVNTRASVDHDCDVGRHVHIAPGATLSGGIRIGEGAFVGAGAVIIQGLNIGEWSTIGAGAVVLRDIPPGMTVAGTPAREIRGRRLTA